MFSNQHYHLMQTTINGKTINSTIGQDDVNQLKADGMLQPIANAQAGEFTHEVKISQS